MRRIVIRLPFIEVTIVGSVAMGRVFGVSFERAGRCVSICAFGRATRFLLPALHRA